MKTNVAFESCVAQAPGDGDAPGEPEGDGTGLGVEPGPGRPVGGWAHPASHARFSHAPAATTQPAIFQFKARCLLESESLPRYHRRDTRSTQAKHWEHLTGSSMR